jgi:thiamine pyrophosphokinase
LILLWNNETKYKVDVLLGDFDRDFDANYYKEHQHPIEIVHTPDQAKQTWKSF